MRTVLHVTGSNARSAYLLSIARLYDRSRFKLMVGSLTDAGPLQEGLRDLRVPSFAIPAGDRYRSLGAVPAFTSLLRRERVDVLHAHTFWPTLVGLIAGRVAGTPRVVFTRHHADHHVRAGKKWHQRIDRLVAEAADTVICVSEFTRQVMIRDDGVKREIAVVPNGIEDLPTAPDLDRAAKRASLGLSPSDVFLLSIARLHPEKDLERILLALSKLPATVKLRVAGAGVGGPEHARLEESAKRLGLGDRVDFLGFRKDIGDLLVAADVFVSASLVESFGFGVLEAMAKSCPVVITSLPAHIEVATRDVALTFAPGNADELAAALRDCMDHPEAARRRAALGRARYEERFRFERMIEAYEKLYDEPLHSRWPPALRLARGHLTRAG